MSRGPKKPPLALDMDFSEALTRFAKVDPDEMKDVIKIKEGGSKPPAKVLKKPS